MNDKLDHFVLEYDDESGLALLAMTEADGGRVADGAGLPYAVASGYEADSRTWESIERFDDVTRAKLRFEKGRGRDYAPTGGGGVHVSVCPVTFGERDLAVYKVDAGKIGDGPITIRDLEDVGAREVHVDDFAEKPEEVRFFLRTDADVYLFGSSLGKSLAVEDADEEDIAPALREVRTYCIDAGKNRDPQLICVKAQAAAAKSATAEGDAGGKKL